MIRRLLLLFLLFGACGAAAQPISLAANEGALVPLTELDTLHVYAVGLPVDTAFCRMAARYTPVVCDTAPVWDARLRIDLAADLHAYAKQTAGRDLRRTIVLALDGADRSLIRRLSGRAGAVLCLERDTPEIRSLAARIVLGGYPLPGGEGIRLDYAEPEEAGVDGAYLRRTVDSLVAAAIAGHAFPGCQILVARQGKVIFSKSYGSPTYRGWQSVTDDHLFDLASCSKVMGATLALMKLTEEGKIDLDAPFSDVFPYFRGSNKEGIRLREFLAHQGGLQPSVDVRGMITDSTGALRAGWFSYTPSEEYPVEVYRNMWGRRDLPERIYHAIAATPLLSKRYRYSCMSFLCTPWIVRALTGTEYPAYLDSVFYRPLGAHRILFRPVHRYPLDRIMPTEVDTVYRFALIHGYVHDESAAMLGGISGNAGLFANARDMAKVLQMLLNGGTYGGRRYLRQQTVDEWTRCQYPENDNRRALGFDKPIWENSERDIDHSYPAPSVSQQAYGHTGFTGTAFWVDPAEQVIFIFLSNRVHPDRKVDALGRLNTRLTTQEAVYEAIRRYRAAHDAAPTLR